MSINTQNGLSNNQEPIQKFRKIKYNNYNTDIFQIIFSRKIEINKLYSDILDYRNITKGYGR